MRLTVDDYRKMNDGDLCVLYRAEKDEQAIKTLIRRHAGFCYDQALKRRSFGIPIEDLVAAGQIGLYEASLTFNPDRGVKFLSYAGEYAKNYMRKVIREDGTKKQKETNLGQKKLAWHVVPGSYLYQKAVPAEEKMIRREQRQRLRKCFGQLTKREQQILLRKFFDPPYFWALLQPGTDIGNKELAASFGIPQFLLRQNLNAAYRKLREGLEREGSDRNTRAQRTRIRREKGTFIEGNFWIIQE